MSTAFERPQLGVHFAQLEAAALSQQDARFILRGINRAGFMTLLRQHPLRNIIFHPRLQDQQGYYNGGYNERTHDIILSLERPAETYGMPLELGELTTVSSAARSRREAIQRSLVHELGHHLISIQRDELTPRLLETFQHKSRPVSRRALVDWREYFCETYVAYVYHRKALENYDPAGHAIIKHIKERMERT